MLDDQTSRNNLTVPVSLVSKIISGMRILLSSPSIRKALLENDYNGSLFYENIRLPNGTFKTTKNGRLSDIDNWLMKYLPCKSDISILDVGVSSAITTVNLDDAFQRWGIHPTIIGIDLFPEAQVTRFGPIMVLFDGSFIYQVDIGPLHIPNSLFPRIWWSFFEEIGRRVVATQPCIIIPFLCGDARKRGIKVVRGDIISGQLDAVGTGFQFVRVMNILNTSYFSDNDIANAIRNLHKVIETGGFMLIGRSKGEQNFASLYRRTESRFDIVDRYGSGCDIESILLSALSE